jgi:hypothetical protein
VEACLPKDAVGGFDAEQERFDVAHDLAGLPGI